MILQILFLHKFIGICETTYSKEVKIVSVTDKGSKVLPGSRRTYLTDRKFVLKKC